MRSFLMTLCLTALAVAPAFATSYHLDKESDFSEGCFDPCMCPIFFSDDLTGQFMLSPTGVENGYRVFQVTEIALAAPIYGRHAKGSGTYRISFGANATQRMELDLVIADGSTEHYDSGFVPARARFPRIQVAISRHGMYCYDRVYAIAASPASRPGPRGVRTLDEPGATTTTWGRIKALYTP